MAALPNLITVEQCRDMEDPPGGKYELHAGELVFVSFVKERHHRRQEVLVDLLRPRLAGFGRVRMEYPYRPLSEFEFRAADVAVISHTRADAVDENDNLRGAPELVIEIKSPSNRRGKLSALAALCLGNGGVEFWVVDMDKKSVTVTRRDGLTTVYGAGQHIPLTAFGGDALPVDEILV
jgi:Uma2 family endonuclease